MVRDDVFLPIVPAIVIAIAGLVIAGLVIMAVFDRIPRVAGAAGSGVVFGAAQTILLWHLDVWGLNISLPLGILTAVVVGSLLSVFLRKAHS